MQNSGSGGCGARGSEPCLLAFSRRSGRGSCQGSSKGGDQPAMRVHSARHPKSHQLCRMSETASWHMLTEFPIPQAEMRRRRGLY